MFENLLHQSRFVNRITGDLKHTRLARSMLFSGDAHGGKLSAALELARVLGCRRKDAPWSCSCNSCSQHRLLESPYLLMMGQRNFMSEIRAAGNMLAAATDEERKPLRFLYYRNVGKLLRRFDSLLWQDDTAKLNKAEKLMSGIQDLLEGLDRGAGKTGRDAGKTGRDAMQRLEESLTELLKLLPADGISINMIRRMRYWCHTADAASPKVVIIESAHEMNDAARNAFLKILEEPPENVFFILITNRPGGVLPTIRSRLREYALAPRGQEEYRTIISRIYRYKNPEDYRSLEAFFTDQAPGGLGEKRIELSLMFRILRERSISARDDLAKRLGSDRRALEDLISLCLEEIRHSHIQSDEFMMLQRKLEDMYYKSAVYNIPVASALEHGYI